MDMNKFAKVVQELNANIEALTKEVRDLHAVIDKTPTATDTTPPEPEPETEAETEDTNPKPQEEAAPAEEDKSENDMDVEEFRQKVRSAVHADKSKVGVVRRVLDNYDADKIHDLKPKHWQELLDALDKS